MAIGYSIEASGKSSRDVTSAAFTPAANSILVAIYGGVLESSGTPEDNAAMATSGLTWTKRVKARGNDTWDSWITIWTAPIGGSPASMTVAATNTGTHDGAYLVVLEVTGHDVANPTGATATADAQTPGAQSITLSAAPNSTSLVIGAVGENSGFAQSVDTDPGADFTEIYDDPAVGSETAGEVQVRTGSTSTTVAWADMTIEFSAALAALEIYADGDAPPPDLTPVIESTDVTNSGSNTATATPAVAYPAYVAGDLLISLVFADGSDDITPPAAGPHSETRVLIKDAGAVDAGSNGPSIAAMYWIGTATRSAATQTWAIGAAQEWIGRTIKVPAGEFDPANPIGTISNAGVSNTDVAGWDSVSFVTQRASSRIVQVMAVDVDPWNATQPAGYTQISNQDIGAVAAQISTRNASTTASETIGSVNFDLSSTGADSLAGFGFEVCAPVTSSEDDLLANDVSSASSVSVPALGQVHALAANDVASASSVSAPALTQTYPLTADDVASASSVTAPAVGQGHALTADDVASASSVTAPEIGQSHSLLANDVASASSVSAPAIGQLHVLNASDVSSASNVSEPPLAEVVPGEDALFADDVVSASSVSTPALTENIDDLLADDVASASGVSTPELGQVHALLANDVVSASTLSAPELEEFDTTDVLLADDLLAGSSVSVPSLGQLHALLANDIIAASNVSAPALLAGSSRSYGVVIG